LRRSEHIYNTTSPRSTPQSLAVRNTGRVSLSCGCVQPIDTVVLSTLFCAAVSCGFL
jgi:hypothetical protein